MHAGTIAAQEHQKQRAIFLLAQASARAIDLLGLSSAALARIIGVSEPTDSRICKGDYPIAPDSKADERSFLLIRVYRSLDALVGTDDEKREAWLRGMNEAPGGVPLQPIERTVSLVATLNDLDGIRVGACAGIAMCCGTGCRSACDA